MGAAAFCSPPKRRSSLKIQKHILKRSFMNGCLCRFLNRSGRNLPAFLIFYITTFRQIYLFMLYSFCCRSHSGNRREVYFVDSIVSFFVSVVAGIVTYYICKWLDSKREFDTLKSKKVPQSLEIGLFFCQIFVFIV